jgi:ribosomal protein S8E
VDNYCHGIAKKALTIDEINLNVRRNLHVHRKIDSINYHDTHNDYPEKNVVVDGSISDILLEDGMILEIRITAPK